MNIKVITGSLALALGFTLGPVAQAATIESSSTTVERSTVAVPKPDAKVTEETTTTTTKRGLLVKTKSKTTTTRSEREPALSTNTEVKSRTTVETEKRY